MLVVNTGVDIHSVNPMSAEVIRSSRYGHTYFLECMCMLETKYESSAREKRVFNHSARTLVQKGYYLSGYLE